MEVQGPLQNFTGINRRVVHRAFLKSLEGQKMVSMVEEKNGKNLPGPVSYLFP